MRSTASFIRIAAFALFGYLFIYFLGSTGETSVFVEYPWLWAIYGVVILIYIASEICIEGLRALLFRTLKAEEKERYEEKQVLAKANQFKWFKETYIKLLGGKPMEEEGEIILDHSYDGIRELDNDLPPWWVYGFYATIIFAVVYMARYHIFDGIDQETEYKIAVAEAQAEIEEYKKTAKDLVDPNTVELLTDASDLNAGKSIYSASCVACHQASGAGGIGPNLTDEYWILGGGIKNVFNTISEGGRAGKGMVPWKSELKPIEIAQVASYVLSLQGTNPADPKDPEGDIWVDDNSNIEGGETIN
ncbi:cytochrome c oxidase cbb3-type subunit 3 [Gillisia sp. Hel_I_86]|uniref:cbb3-type cytochrome c oxidase N-terminal domain-containing protein n=1 Tax=Gillisia sp. Hel_I_86 TaxID=1249981 RepID=UPI001198CCBA|nr:cbb3-type cytochrome c oxidase N-terminal domain-containing protein [Gillisia sp. Hel_I_86]TVZ25531.1 cytochrome c oxidase cbb3-type subunit 3 [Gillisia sp. Hel_I_86]